MARRAGCLYVRPVRTVRGAMRLLRTIAGLAGAALLALVALGYGAPFFYELDLLAHFRLHLLGLSGIIALAALVLRARGALWRAVAAAVLALAGLGPLWEGSGPAGTGRPVTVATANLYWHNERPEEMRRAVLAADADILLTVETSRERVGGAGAFAEAYPHYFVQHPGSPDWRLVLWSRLPIREGGHVLLDPEHGAAYGVQAVVEIAPGRTLSVLGLHLEHVSVGSQGAQVEALGRLAADLPRPLVVMGDFNATAWSWAVHRAEALTGTRRVGGVTRTWHGHYPTPLVRVPEPFGLPIDHVLVSPEIGVEQIGTLGIPGSDHDAVRAVLRIPD